MDMVIKTGFQAVTVEILFNPETIKKGNALASGHVYRVHELHSNGSGFIRGSVIRQTSVTEHPYQVELEINSYRHVTAATCTCISQAGHKCKHIYALIRYINMDVSASKTSEEQGWGKPSDKQLGSQKYAKGIVVTDKFQVRSKKAKRPAVEPLRLSLENVPSRPCALTSIIRSSMRSVGEKIVRGILNACLDEAVSSCLTSESEICALDLVTRVVESDLYINEFLLKDEKLRHFYEFNVILSESEIIRLCASTVMQSECAEWFDNRELRLSASSKAHSIKVRQRKTIPSLINDFLSRSNVKSDAIDWGKKMEKHALDEYAKKYEVKVIPVGLIVLISQPWLCASPDGVVIEDSCITKLVEVKCPYSCKNKSIIDPETNQPNVGYLVKENDSIILRTSSQYYTQCQLQMYVTGLTVCDLYVWSPKESHCVEVHRDDKFLQDLIKKLGKFYFNHYLEATFSARKENM